MFHPNGVRRHVSNWPEVAVTTLGTPQDVTLQELRIECFFPMTLETRSAAHQLAQT